MFPMGFQSAECMESKRLQIRVDSIGVGVFEKADTGRPSPLLARNSVEVLIRRNPLEPIIFWTSVVASSVSPLQQLAS